MRRRIGWPWIRLIVIAFMALAMGAACTVTRTFQVMDPSGKPVTMKVKTKRYSNALVSATVEGGKVGISDPVTIDPKNPIRDPVTGVDVESCAISLGAVTKSVGCSYCAYIGGRWIYYPPTCRCP